MRYPEHVLVMLATTLAGGIERSPRPLPANATCGRGTFWADCAFLDEEIAPTDVLLPWAVTLGTLLFLSMPSVLLRSRHKIEALSILAWTYVQYLCLLVLSTMSTDHPCISFTLSLHSCVRLLARMEVTNRLVGGSWWWALRFLAMAGLLAWAVLAGAPISVVRWAEQDDPACAYRMHLTGCIAPDLVLYLLYLLGEAGSCFRVRDD
jgi:hypothetical protein